MTVPEPEPVPERLSDEYLRGVVNPTKGYNAVQRAMAAELLDLRRGALASPEEDDTGRCRECGMDVPLTRQREVEHHYPNGNTQALACLGSLRPPAASPRREAPADEEAEDALAAIVNAHWGEANAARTTAQHIIAAGYQLVPAGHHVSPEGQTVIDGKRWEHESWERARNEQGSQLLRPTLRPVGPSGEGAEG